MSSTLVDLTAQKDRAIAAAEEIISRAERQKRTLSHIEDNLVRQHTQEATDLNAEIQRIQSRNPRAELTALRGAIPKTAFAFPSSDRGHKEPIAPKYLSAEHVNAFLNYGKSGGQIDATASYEGGSTSGAPIVPSQVDQTPAPFSPPDQAVLRLATVIPTTMDRKLPQTTALPTAGIKPESGASNNAFPVSDPTRSQTTLSAFMTTVETDFSYELFEDWVLAEATTLRDSGLALAILEEAKYVNGSGSGEPQGILGNIGAGITGATPDTAGNLVSVDSLYRLVSTLKAAYDPNASFLMSKITALGIRRAQSGGASTNRYEPVFRRENGQDFCLGYPVFYSASMPSAAPGATPVVFGDFKAGYIVGQRGGSAVRLKIIDQDAAKALEGLIPALIFRRSDGRVLQPEALQGLTLHT